MSNGQKIQGREPRQRIVVVGGGFAGLAAAWRLQQSGHSVQLLERRPRAGGRIASDWVDGFCLDTTVQVSSTANRHLMQLIGELELGDQLLPLRPVQICQVHRDRVLPIEPQRVSGVSAIPGVSRRDALKLVRWRRLFARYRRLLAPEAPERAAELDFRSAADFTRLYFGKTPFDYWVSPEITSLHGGDPHEISRVAILQHWANTGTGRERPAVHGVARRGLSGIVSEICERIDVRTGVEVSRVDESPSGGFVLECGTADGKHGVLEADAVVLATGASEAGRLAASMLSPAERDHLSQVRYGPSVTLAAAVSRPLAGMPQLIRAPHCEGHVVDVVLVEPGVAESRAPVGSALVTARASDAFANANAGASDDVVEKGLIAAIERLFPEAHGRIRHARLERREAAIPRFDVGAYRALARFDRVQTDRRALSRSLYFAGDHRIGPDVEAAVISGFRAARDIGEDLSALGAPI
jgi:oxygen-dependent protoporphyrinogen oxidase